MAPAKPPTTPAATPRGRRRQAPLPPPSDRVTRSMARRQQEHVILMNSFNDHFYSNAIELKNKLANDSSLTLTEEECVFMLLGNAKQLEFTEGPLLTVKSESVPKPPKVVSVKKQPKKPARVTKAKSKCTKITAKSSSSTKVPLLSVVPSPSLKVISENKTKQFNTRSTKTAVPKAKSASALKAKTTKAKPKSPPKSQKRSRAVSIKPVQPKKKVKASDWPVCSSFTNSRDRFFAFLKQEIPFDVPANLMEHLVEYFCELFSKPKENSLSNSLFALHQACHARCNGPKEGKDELMKEQEVMLARKNQNNLKLFIWRLFNSGYVQEAIECLFPLVNPEDPSRKESIREIQRMDRFRLPFLYKFCSDCRLMLVPVLFLANLPSVKYSRDCPFSLIADVRRFLTSEATFVDWYNYFKVSRLPEFITATLKWYNVPKPDDDDAYDMDKADFSEL